MKDVVVYTAISKGYDTLMPPPASWLIEADFVAFLEEIPACTDWDIRPLCQDSHDPCRNAKIHKILAHRYFPNARYSLWIDGSVQIISNSTIMDLIKDHLGHHDLAVFKHHSRCCLYKEGIYCISKGLDYRGVIEEQLSKYRNLGYPQDNGLAECTVLLRRHTDKIKNFNEAWYHEIQAHSRRDQISFNFVAHQMQLKYAHLPGSMCKNQFFKWLQNKAARSPLCQVKEVAVSD